MTNAIALLEVFVLAFYPLAVLFTADGRVIQFSTLQKSPFYKDQNGYLLFNEDLMYYEAIQYENKFENLFILTETKINRYSTSNYKKIETLEIKPSTRRPCYKNNYLDKYSCHVSYYWARIYSSIPLQKPSQSSSSSSSSSSQDNSNVADNLKDNEDLRAYQLFICNNNYGSATFANVQKMSDQYTKKTNCLLDVTHSIMDSDYSVYNVDFRFGPRLIRYAPDLPGNLKKSAVPPIFTPSKSEWLQQHKYLDIIYLFENDIYVYLVFKEICELHYSYCDKEILRSRIARVSKKDKGGHEYRLNNNWITFVKADLFCPNQKESTKKQSSLSFVEGAYFDVEQKLLYAVFSNGPSGPKASVICGYLIRDIDLALDGPYYNPNTPQSPIRELHTNCPGNKIECISEIASKYQLKFESIKPIGQKMMAQQYGEIWKKVAVLKIERSSRQYHILFVATSDFSIKKFYRKVTDNKLCYAGTIELSAIENNPRRILDLKIINSKNSIEPVLLIATPRVVYRMSVETCQLYRGEKECQDVVCFWSSIHNQCQTIYKISVFQLRTLPELSVCQESEQMPQSRSNENRSGANIMTDWSVWETCGTKGTNLCECRTRRCQIGMCPSVGESANTKREIQVRNCSINHKWSHWSTWSDCSTSCGNGVQSRKRWCFQAEKCSEDKAIETRPCNNNKNCTDIKFLKFTEWSQCNTACGTGQMYRHKCNDMSREDCKLVEVKQCTGTNCGGTKKRSTTISVKSEGGTEYYIALCSSDDSEDKQLTLNVEVETEDYATKYESLSTCWSDWSNCSCDSAGNLVENKRVRERSCVFSENSQAKTLCFGNYTNTKECKKLCAYVGQAGLGSGLLDGNRKYELVYLILTGVGSFAITVIIVIISFHIHIKRKKTLKKYTSRPSLLRTTSLPMRDRADYISHSPSEYSPTGYLHSPTLTFPTYMSTIQRNAQNQRPNNGDRIGSDNS